MQSTFPYFVCMRILKQKNLLIVLVVILLWETQFILYNYVKYKFSDKTNSSNGTDGAVVLNN